MIKILYFASLREKLGTASEDLELPAGVADVGGVLADIEAAGGRAVLQASGVADVGPVRVVEQQEQQVGFGSV